PSRHGPPGRAARSGRGWYRAPAVARKAGPPPASPGCAPARPPARGSGRTRRCARPPAPARIRFPRSRRAGRGRSRRGDPPRPRWSWLVAGPLLVSPPELVEVRGIEETRAKHQLHLGGLALADHHLHLEGLGLPSPGVQRVLPGRDVT